MIQAFEIWLKQNEALLYPDAIGLFKDSLKCFKNDIDRPSYCKYSVNAVLCA